MANGEKNMPCTSHTGQDHKHGKDCGHVAVHHEDHVDYLHDNHLHHPHDGHVDEHKIEINKTNASECTPEHKCSGHEAAHKHGASCGHTSVPHGDHTDYLVSGHLHHPCGGHCDEHGKMSVA